MILRSMPLEDRTLAFVPSYLSLGEQFLIEFKRLFNGSSRLDSCLFQLLPSYGSLSVLIHL